MRRSWSRIAALSVLMLPVSGLLTGCHSLTGQVMNASGRGYYDQGNYAKAAQEFEIAARSEPGNADFLANLAKARQKMGDVAGAEQIYRRAIAISPSHQPSYHGLSELLVRQGRGHEAETMLTAWAGTQPYVAESHLELAWLRREQGQPQAAAAALQQALAVNPQHSRALALMGQYYEDAGQPGQALTMYQQALRSEWNQPEVHSRVAAVTERIGSGHPMTATAMARGVHPSAFPNRMAMAGTSGMMSGPAMAWNSPAPSMVAMPAGPMTAGMGPGMMGPPMNGMTVSYPGPATSAVTHTAMTPQFPSMASAVSAGTPAIGLPLPTGSTIPVTNSAQSPSPAPQPDPMFANPAPTVTAGHVPVTAVSQETAVSEPVDSANLPVVNPF